ncbi:MAG: putative Ig domain-containing protein, partial [Pseudomonadota bacterium]
DAAFSFAIPAGAFSDEDGDALDVQVSGLPAWASYDPASDTISGTPGATDAGTTTVTVTADDASGGALASTSFDLTVSDPASTPGSAVLRIHENIGAPEVSSFKSDSFELTNTGSKDIASITIDLAGAILTVNGSRVIFDPLGTAGDTAAKGLDINTDGGTGAIEPSDPNDLSNPALLTPFAGAVDGGYTQMTVDFDPAVNGGFNPGETVGFSVDLDPTGIKDIVIDDAGGSVDPGGIAGFEMSGGTLTVRYTDGEEQTGFLFVDRSTANKEADAIAAVGFGTPAPAPTVSIAGQQGEVTTAPGSQTVTINGTPNADVAVVVSTGRTDINVTPTSPFFANNFGSSVDQTITLDGGGQATLNVTAVDGDPVFVAAAELDANGYPGAVSTPLIVATEDVFDFSTASISDYAGEGAVGSSSVIEGGDGIALTGDGWASAGLDADYAITANTLLTFQFRTNNEGSTHAIGLDDADDGPTGAVPIFQVAGAGTDPAVTSDISATGRNVSTDDWTLFEVSLAAFDGLNADQLVFVNEEDGASAATVTSEYRDVWLHEADVVV